MFSEMEERVQQKSFRSDLSSFEDLRHDGKHVSCPPGSEDLVWYNNPGSCYSLPLCSGQY